jgi:hypothetical protein
MNINVYRIDFDKSSFELNEDYELLSEVEQEKISSLDTESFFDYEDDFNNYICYLICNAIEIKKYSDVLKNNFIGHEITNLSEDILNFKINLEEELKPLLTTINSIKYSFFIDDLNDWIFENLNIDNVLDRISEVGGVKNLTSIEKEFLKNFQLP